jgi:molybdenum cofactor biosynthesis protein MoaC
MDAEKKVEQQHIRLNNYHMINVGRKRVTHRRAFASGVIIVGSKALKIIKNKALPKGDVLSLAEISGVLGAKKTSELLPMCHILPLDQVLITCEIKEPNYIIVYSQVETHAKTGVEMEALMAVMSALGTIWDLTKAIEPALEIKDVKLLAKEGGKKGLWRNPDGVPAIVEEKLSVSSSLSSLAVGTLIVSDRAYRGDYEDRTGTELKVLLQEAGATLAVQNLVPDEKDKIKQSIFQMCERKDIELLIVSGGTGIGPRDVTTEVVSGILDKSIPGIGELLRQDGSNFTPYSWVSRSLAGIYKGTLIICLPGSPKAVRQGLEVLYPIVSHSLKMMKGEGHE